MDHAKWKSAFEDAQCTLIQIILHMQQVLSGPLLSIHTFCSIQWLLADSEGPDQTAQMHRLMWAYAVIICPKTPFCMAQSKDMFNYELYSLTLNE